MDDATFGKLLERQREMEDNSLALGGQRFRKRIETATLAGKASTVGAAKKLVQSAIDPLEAAINNFIEESTARRGPKHFAVKWCVEVGADAAAYMTVKTVLDGAAKRPVVRFVAGEISQLILDELRYRRFMSQAPGLFQYRMSQFHTSSYAHMARSMNAAMKYGKVDVSDLDMAPSTRLLVGTKLLDLLIESTGLVEIISRKKPKRSKRDPLMRELYVQATEDTQKWMRERNHALEFLQPVTMPMVVPPIPWTPQERGGYRFALRNKFRLVRGASAEHEKTIAATEMPQVYEALNLVQQTAWRINPAVLELVDNITGNGGGLAGIPSFEDEPLPKRPEDIDTNEEARKKWRRAAGLVRERNHMRSVRALEHTKVLSCARPLAVEEAVYFPYNLDFRGRVYPISNYLTPQGGDLARALLTFADAKPVGSDGGTWLAIHGANCLGESPEGQKMSKLSFVEREQWVVDHTAEILRVAEDPLSATWWMAADKPLQFYAFCIEWRGFIAACAEGNGEEFVSGLPIAQDGSCNGLQHFSALFLDAVGGKAVNLVPGDRPEDIYQRIADKVMDKLEPAAHTDAHARKWLTSSLVNRKLTKRPTMTFGYGSKKFGFRSQLIEYLLGLEDWQKVKLLFTEDGVSDIGDACSLMSQLIWDSLRDTVVAAFDGMAWMQAATRVVIQNGKPVYWSVPVTHFPVRQEYFVNSKKPITTILAGKVIRPRVYESTSIIERHKQTNAIAPNFVHSLDAAALHLTVSHASSLGIEAFGMIHDSYATVAGDVSVLAQATRQSFVMLYSQGNVVQTLFEQFKAQALVPDEVPTPPKMGDLDIGHVLASQYFFA